MKILALSLLAGCLLVGCANNPAADRPQAVVNPSSPASPASPAGSPVQGDHKLFTIDQTNSKIEFVGSKVTGSHDCSFKKFQGTIDVVDNEPTRSTVSVTIDMTSVETDDEDLTTHLKSADFFDVEKFPESTFKSTLIAKSDRGYTMTGDLTLHGVTNSITFPAEIAVAPDSVTAKAEFSIKRFDWKILYPGKADNLIRDEVLIKLDLKGSPAAAGSPSPGAASPDADDPSPDA